MKLDVVDSLCFAPLLGELESLCVKIDPNDRTLGANQARHKETDIANAATDIKYAHAAANPGRKQHPLGQRSNQLGLLDQTAILGPRTAKRKSVSSIEIASVSEGLATVLYERMIAICLRRPRAESSRS